MSESSSRTQPMVEDAESSGNRQNQEGSVDAKIQWDGVISRMLVSSSPSGSTKEALLPNIDAYLAPPVSYFLEQIKDSGDVNSIRSWNDFFDETVSYRYDSKNFVDERHRHRYEVNPDDMVEILEKASLSFASKDETGKRMEVKEDLVKTEKGKFVTEEAVNPPYICLRNMIIGCFLIFYIISVFLDIAAKFSTNYSSSSPRFDAKSCRSFTDAKTNSNLATSPVSYPIRIAVSSDKVHQVFLNFRGEQLRYNFVSHLCDAFQKHEIKFFIDKYEQRGKDLKHLFFRIEESSIALAIFSTRYPESSWCMDELVKMKELADQGKLRVIPIFYKVEAEDVRKPTSYSEFGKNFWRLAEASSVDQIKKWKEALESISDKMGLSVGEKSSEIDFVYEIVKEVKRVEEAIGLEEEEKPFWWEKLGRKVGNFNYLLGKAWVINRYLN